MKIHSLSKVIAFPLVVITGFIILYTFSGYRSEHSIWIFVPVLLLVTIYIFHGVIDHWYLERNPIPIDAEMRAWFEKYTPYYNNLEPNEKVLFENRLSLYVNGREFKSVGTNELKDVPYDIQCIIASQVIKMTRGMSDYLLGDVDRIYLYKHPFPSPAYQFLHTVETHIEDGIILLSSEHALPGIVNPNQHYNIAMHAYAEAFIRIHPDKGYPNVSHHDWKDLEAVLHITREKLLKTIGFESCDVLIPHIVAFFDFPEAYRSKFNYEFNAFQKIFNLD
jgi:hypothetical protein